jgi:mono/diheme cytochrome c family protein
MRTNWSRPGVGVLAALLAVALGVAAHGWSAQAPQAPTIKTVPCESIASVEGKDSYGAYCAVCHGSDGKGFGPAAPAFKMPVPDLTALARRQGGKFNVLEVEYAITGMGKVPPAHGTTTMPIWGPVFRAADVDKARSTLRVQNLAKYIGTLQQM